MTFFQSMALRPVAANVPTRILRTIPASDSCLSHCRNGQIASKHIKQQLRYFAHPVIQNGAGSKGPTAIVFLNMGGPSTVNEVGDFLSRLFVSPTLRSHGKTVPLMQSVIFRQMAT